jgi:hypothetical protein
LKAVEWTHLAEEMDKWRALVDRIINLRFPKFGQIID